MVNIINDQYDEKSKEKVDLYIRVFWEEPRNEWYECKNEYCNRQYYALSEVNTKELTECLQCWEQLEKVYNEDDLEKDWEKRNAKEWYTERLAEKNIDEIKDETSKLVGFILWWNDDIDTLNKDKFWLTKEEVAELRGNILKMYPDFDLSDFYYFSEIWVEKEFRGTDDRIAHRLYESMEEQVIKNWKKCIILRTTQKSDLPFKRFKKIWYNVVFNYNDENDRVIMIKKMNE